ncbi:MAG: HAMP domain-containing sensor histidine kinase [Lysobacterales bacterium]
MARRSLRRSAYFRFAVLLPLLISALAAALLVPIYREAVGHIRDETRASIESESWDLEVEFHENGLDGLIAEIAERTERQVDPRAVYLLLDSDQVVRGGTLERWPQALPASTEGWSEFALDDGELVHAQVHTLFGGRKLLVGRRSPLARFDEHLATQMIWAALAVFAASAIAAGWFTWRQRRRLRGLARGAEAIRGGELTRRLSVSERHDELDELAEGFNRTFADLERLVDGVRQVSNHLAHDLRRPLQQARQRLDQLAARPGLDLEARCAIEGSLQEIDGLLHTFAALLRLGRLESGGFERSQERCALDTVVRDAVDLFAPLAEAQGRAIQAQLAPVQASGDRHLWFQLVQNLIDNAIQHGAGAIDIELDADQLCIRDHGSGVPAEQLHRLGERFFRVDAARSTPGVGIGLALVRAIAEHLGTPLHFENAEPGLRARILLRAPLKS